MRQVLCKSIQCGIFIFDNLFKYISMKLVIYVQLSIIYYYWEIIIIILIHKIST